MIDDAGRADAPSAGKSTLIKILSDGKLDATFVYPTGGRQVVDLAAKILAGEQGAAPGRPPDREGGAACGGRAMNQRSW